MTVTDTSAAAISLGGMTIERHTDGLTVTRLADGAEIHARPQDDGTYRARAVSLGYGADTAAMSREHELGHAILATMLGLPESPTLRGVADGNYWPNWREEEAAVLALQAYARAAGVGLEDIADRIGTHL